ncbi:MAG TPA: aminopeptidase [Anaeromyxobacteraceae bacterium]|nr:aminopeptidase [Anaeromyxobacteraceae bacterium]
MARSKSKHIRLIMKRRQKWKRRTAVKKAAKKAASKK